MPAFFKIIDPIYYLLATAFVVSFFAFFTALVNNRRIGEIENELKGHVFASGANYENLKKEIKRSSEEIKKSFRNHYSNNDKQVQNFLKEK